jgi:hypothetical protein
MIYNNLLPKEYQKRTNQEKMTRFFLLFYFYAAIVFASGAVLLLPAYFSLTFQEEDILRQINLTKKSVEARRVEEAEQSIRDVNKKLEVLAAHRSSPISSYLAALSEKTLAGVTLSSIIYSKEKQTMEIHGKALERPYFLKFLENLKQEEKFKSIDSPISNLLKERDLDFVVTIVLGRPEKK